MGLIDILVIITMIISVLFALYRGLLRELLGISSWILAALGALYSYQPLYGALLGKVEKIKIWSLSLSLLIALVILIVMTILNAHITKKLRKSSLSGLDRILGTAFGVLRAGLLIVLVWLFASQMAFSKVQMEKMKKENISVPYIQILSDKVEKILPQHLQEDIKRPVPPKKVKEKKAEKTEIEYKEADRKALENMMEDIVEIEEL